jgi:hypothetical protein
MTKQAQRYNADGTKSDDRHGYYASPQGWVLSVGGPGGAEGLVDESDVPRAVVEAAIADATR